MGDTARWIFDVSWQAGILIAFVVALRWIFGRSLTPAWRCALWALVAIRLVVPGVVPLATRSGGVASATPSPAATRDIPGFTVTVTKFWDGLTSRHPSSSTSSTPGHSAGSASDHSAAPDSFRSIAHLSWPWIWSIGAVVVAARLAATNLRLARRIRRMTPITDARILSAITNCAAEMGVRATITAVSTADVRTPALYGLRRPVLMLPATCPLTGDDLRMVLLHELAHVRRRDVHAELLTGLLTAIHWFNPLVWLAASLCRADREFACDAAVLHRVGPHHGPDYGACLLRVLQSVAGLPPEPAAVGAFGRTANLRRRLTLIASYHGHRSPAAYAVGLAAFIAIGCAASTSLRTDRKPTTPPPAASVDLNPTTRPTVTDAATHALLDKKLPEIRFDNKPFAEVIDDLRQATGANIFVNWNALAAAGIERNVPITTRLRNVRAAKALDTVLRYAGGTTVRLAYVIDDGVVTVSTAEDLSHGTSITRVYDIRDLLVEMPDYGPPPTDPLAPATTRPTTDPAKPTRAERVAQISSMIQQVVDPDSWRDAGGTVGSLRELSGQLIVTQTPDNQAAVARLLETFRAGRAVQVTIESRYVFVDQKTLDDMGTDWAGDYAKKGTVTFVTDDKVNRFIRAAQKGMETTILTAPRVTLFNGQRAWLKATRATGYVKDFVVVRTKDGETRYEPQMGAAEAGLTLELRGTVSADRTSVTTSVRSVESVLRGMNSHPFSGGIAGLQVQSPDLTARTTETTATIPNGQTLIMVALTPEAADGITRPKGQTFILIKPTIIIQRESSPPARTPK